MKSDVTSEQIHATLMTVIKLCNDLKGGQLYCNATSHHALCNNLQIHSWMGGMSNHNVCLRGLSSGVGVSKSHFRPKITPKETESWRKSDELHVNLGTKRVFMYFFSLLTCFIQKEHVIHSSGLIYFFWNIMFFLFLFFLSCFMSFFWNIMRNNFI